MYIVSEKNFLVGGDFLSRCLARFGLVTASSCQVPALNGRNDGLFCSSFNCFRYYVKHRYLGMWTVDHCR